ncbi:MAG: hypothetical protein PG979_001553 [Rickettsia asembonensis]|nr:MAG: hypothetical protein PG979_001553 [Rickettsia asembonensis]
MSNHNSLEVQEYAQSSSLNNTNLTASQGVNTNCCKFIVQRVEY